MFEVYKKWLHPQKNVKNILIAFTGGVETTLLAYMACKYYEKKDDVKLYFYTVNVLPAQKEPWVISKDQYKPQIEVTSAAHVLAKLSNLTTKRWTHLCKYHSQEEVDEMQKKHGYYRFFDVTRHFDLPFALDICETQNIDVWYSGRNKMFDSKTVSKHVEYLQTDQHRIDALDVHAFAKLDRPIVEYQDRFVRITPFLDETKDKVTSIYQSLGIENLYKETLSCPYQYNSCYGKCKNMITDSELDYKTNCFERITSESITNI